MSLFKANSTCHLNLFVISPGTLLLSAASMVFLCDSSFPPKHTCHGILYLSKQKDLDQIPLSTLFYSSASFRTNSLKSLYLAPPILLSHSPQWPHFAPRMPLKLPLSRSPLTCLVLNAMLTSLSSLVALSGYLTVPSSLPRIPHLAFRPPHSPGFPFSVWLSSSAPLLVYDYIRRSGWSEFPT